MDVIVPFRSGSAVSGTRTVHLDLQPSVYVADSPTEVLSALAHFPPLLKLLENFVGEARCSEDAVTKVHVSRTEYRGERLVAAMADVELGGVSHRATVTALHHWVLLPVLLVGGMRYAVLLRRQQCVARGGGETLEAFTCSSADCGSDGAPPRDVVIDEGAGRTGSAAALAAIGFNLREARMISPGRFTFAMDGTPAYGVMTVETHGHPADLQRLQDHRVGQLTAVKLDDVLDHVGDAKATLAATLMQASA